MSVRVFLGGAWLALFLTANLLFGGMVQLPLPLGCGSGDLSAASLLGHSVSTEDEKAPSKREGEIRAKIKQLQLARRKLLRGSLHTIVAIYQGDQAGRVDFRGVLQIEERSLAADLDACESADERVGVFREHFEWSQKMVRLVETLFKAGKVARLDLDLARAHAMEIEIKLLHTQLPSPR